MSLYKMSSHEFLTHYKKLIENLHTDRPRVIPKAIIERDIQLCENEFIRRVGPFVRKRKQPESGPESEERKQVNELVQGKSECDGKGVY